jgi:hypothetical protein
MNEVILNISDFSKVISENIKNKDLMHSLFIDILMKYKNTKLGCPCSLSKRVIYANDFFKKTLPLVDPSKLQVLKNILNTEKIKFQDDKNIIFFEV